MGRVEIRPWMVWSGIVLLAVCVGLALLLLRSDSKRDLSFDSGSVGMSLSDIELVHGKEGKKLWELSAEESVFRQGSGEVELSKPRFSFNLSEKDEDVRVRASQGRLNRNRKAVRLWPDVVVHYAGSVLRADSMEYAESDETLVFTGHVRLRDPRMSVSSQEATFNLQNRQLLLKKEVHVVLQ